MAGPLSIASGIIAVVQGANGLVSLLKKVKTYWAARDEILALINEISDIRLILKEHTNIAEKLNHIKEEPRIRLHHLLNDTKAKILQIEALIQNLVRLRDLNGPGICKLSWVRKKSHLDKLRRELKDLRQSISDHFVVINLHSQSQLGFQIQHITVDTSELRIRQHQSEISTTNQFTEVFNNQQNIIQRFDEAEINVLNLVATSSRQIEERLEDTEGMVLHMLNSQRTMQNMQRMMHDLMLEMSKSSQSHLRITTSNFPSNRCSIQCICCRHRRKNCRVGSLVGLLGKLVVGYSGLPITTPPCDYQDCLRRISTVKIVYAFPAWFVARVVFLSFSGGLVPKASLKVVSYLTNSAANALIKFIEGGDVKGVQRLLTRGLISPDSIVRIHMPLNYALAYRKLEMCELLLAAGADPNISGPEDQTSAFDLAQRFKFSGSFGKETPAFVRKFAQLFPRQADEFASIPVIHRIVLGLSRQPLTEYLDEYDGPLDHTKLWGYAPLEWTLVRKDSSTLRCLLEYEENESKRRSLAESVMWMARCMKCVETLLAAGANINTISVLGENLLYNSLRHSEPYSFILQLLELGADPNSYDTTLGDTALMTCCFADKVDIAALLIKYGANVNFTTPHKKIVWGFAVWLNAHKCLELFLQHGLDLSIKNGKMQTTVLHEAAMDADIKTMEILANSRIRGVDVDGKELEFRKTARELLRERDDYSPEVHEAFEALVFSIRLKDKVLDTTSQNTNNMPGAWIEVEKAPVEVSEDGLAEVKISSAVLETNLEELSGIVGEGIEYESEVFKDAVEYPS